MIVKTEGNPSRLQAWGKLSCCRTHTRALTLSTFQSRLVLPLQYLIASSSRTRSVTLLRDHYQSSILTIADEEPIGCINAQDAGARATARAVEGGKEFCYFTSHGIGQVRSNTVEKSRTTQVKHKATTKQGPCLAEDHWGESLIQRTPSNGAFLYC